MIVRKQGFLLRSLGSELIEGTLGCQGFKLTFIASGKKKNVLWFTTYLEILKHQVHFLLLYLCGTEISESI